MVDYFKFKKVMSEPNSICIFTDASVTRCAKDSTFIASAGFYIPYNAEYSLLLKNSTNNEGEVFAILLALSSITTMKYIDNIYIISDSNITVSGLNDWIFRTWKNKNGILTTTSGSNVSNQNIFKRIIYLISNILIKNVRFIHISGHINTDDKDQVLMARDIFININKLDITIDDIVSMANYNNTIDNLTRSRLTQDSDNLITADKFLELQKLCFNLKNEEDYFIRGDFSDYYNLVKGE